MLHKHSYFDSIFCTHIKLTVVETLNFMLDEYTSFDSSCTNISAFILLFDYTLNIL